jgi:hypothetical protein
VPITLRAGAVIAGRVMDQENRPVAGARIELRPQNSSGWWINGEDPNLTVTGTNSDGEFRFQGLGMSMYTISAQVRGFSAAWKGDLDLSTGASFTNVLLMVEAGSPMKGVVVDTDEKPIAGANVNVWTQKGNGQAVSDVEGKFVVESVPKGVYDVYATVTGFAPTRLSKQTVTSESGLRIVMKREAVLKGTVIDAETKKPVAPFGAFLINEDNKQGWRRGPAGGMQSDKDGKFQVQAPQGTYRLEITANGYVKAKKEGIVLQPGTEPDPVKIEMKRGGSIEGIVRGPSGQPEAFVQLFVGKDDGSGAPFNAHAFSEHDGYFFVGDLDSGTYSAIFQKHESPLLVIGGVFVGGEKPAFVDAQIESVAVVAFDFAVERPKDEETVAGASGDAPPAKPWRSPRVRAWIESLDATPLAINQEWGGNEERFKPLTRKELYVGYRQEQFTVQVRDLPAGKFVLKATARGFYDSRVPFQVQRGARWHIPVAMRPLPKEERANLPDNSGRRVAYWSDENGIRHEYYYYNEDE